jgi:hypothetical protein
MRRNDLSVTFVSSRNDYLTILSFLIPLSIVNLPEDSFLTIADLPSPREEILISRLSTTLKEFEWRT